LAVMFAIGVLWEYAGLAYPHPAYLFHLHTVGAAIFVVTLVFTSSWSIRARHCRQSLNHEAAESLLSWHKRGNMLLVFISAVTAILMLYKKWTGGLGLLVFSGRMPSYHATAGFAWVALEVGMVSSGLVIYMGRDGEMPQFLKSLAVGTFSSVGNARKVLRPLHSYIGLVALTVGLGLAALGLTEKNDDASKKRLAGTLVLIWILLVWPSMKRDA